MNLQKSSILVTGSSSGLGRELFENIGNIPFDKGDNLEEIKEVDVIIHCAFNSSQIVDTNNLAQYFNDNVLLTRKLLEIPHKKFIFISSIDVYPKNGKKHLEDEVINLNENNGIYGITKLISESLVKRSPNFLILRCGAMLGKYSRKSSLIKILEGEEQVTLAKTSEFNYILHQDVLEFIKIALTKNLQGIFNVVSSKNIKLADVVRIFKKSVKFGKYNYQSGRIKNLKAAKLCPRLQRSSKEVVIEMNLLIDKPDIL